MTSFGSQRTCEKELALSGGIRRTNNDDQINWNNPQNRWLTQLYLLKVMYPIL